MYNQGMETVTLPKIKYEILEKKAKLYSSLFEKEEEIFPIEMYSPSRIKEFFKEDKVSSKTVREVNKLLRKSG